MMISSLRGSAARPLDVLTMIQCAAALAWRRTAVRSGGSVGGKEGAHLHSGQSQATMRRRSAQRRCPRGRVLAAYNWTVAGRRRFSSPATNLQQGLRASTRAHGHGSSSSTPTLTSSVYCNGRRGRSVHRRRRHSTASARILKNVTFPLATDRPRLAPTPRRELCPNRAIELSTTETIQITRVLLPQAQGYP